MVGQARVPQVVPYATKYAKHHVRYTLASKMRTESCLDLARLRDLATTAESTNYNQRYAYRGLEQIVCEVETPFGPHF